MSARYDTIGVSYSDLRKPDPRIAALIDAALGSAKTVLNVGAGTGSYESASRQITAVEPSFEMLRQRTSPAASVIRGCAEDLPFADGSFDAAMAVLTIHHWTDQAKGCAELRRVTRGPIVILTYDPAVKDFWLADYIPALITLDEGQMPPMAQYEQWLGPVEITPVPIPHDCIDGFLCAYWRRPTSYLDPHIRAAISSFWALGDISHELAALKRDIDDGVWAQRYAHVVARDQLDCGYRLVVTLP